MRHKLFVMLALLLMSTSTHAEPSDDVRFLINEPLSVWDFGMYRLGNDLKDLSIMPSKQKFHILTTYHPDTNRIEILAFAPLD
jgi:hypothetical protein